MVLLLVVFVVSVMLSGCGQNGGKDEAPEFILVGRPNPRTGPIAPLGAVTPWAEQKVIDFVNEQGGIYIEEYDKKIPIKIVEIDTESSPDRASEAASRLVLNEGVHILLTLYTPDVTAPVAYVAEREGVPNVSIGTPIEPWLMGGPYYWSFHTFFSSGVWMQTYEGMWSKYKDDMNVVGLAMPDDVDGVVLAEAFNSYLPGEGYRVVDVGRFPFGMTDYGSMIRTWESEGVDILTAVMIPPDFATLWRQMHREGVVPKIASIAKAILLPGDIEALGPELGHGLTREIWWHPSFPYTSALTGASAQDVADMWEDETGKQWTGPIGFNYCGMEIVVDVLTRAASLDPEKIRQALLETNLETVAGHIIFNEDQVCATPVVGGQWVKGEKWMYDLEIVYNGQFPEVPITAEMLMIGDE